jgi:hypothetical protein
MRLNNVLDRESAKFGKLAEFRKRLFEANSNDDLIDLRIDLAKFKIEEQWMVNRLIQAVDKKLNNLNEPARNH